MISGHQTHWTKCHICKCDIVAVTKTVCPRCYHRELYRRRHPKGKYARQPYSRRGWLSITTAGETP